MQDKLLPSDRILAIQEEIAGFLLDQVIDPKGEYYYPLPPPWTTCHCAPEAPRQHMQEKLYMYIHVYVWIINGVGCETFKDKEDIRVWLVPWGVPLAPARDDRV